MTSPARRPWIYAIVGAVTAAAGIALALLLLKQGLDNTDKISSVISMVVGVASLVIGFWSIRQTRIVRRRDALSTTTPEASPRYPAPPGSGSNIYIRSMKNIREAYIGDRIVNNTEKASREDGSSREAEARDGEKVGDECD